MEVRVAQDKADQLPLIIFDHRSVKRQHFIVVS